jgi:hypothetical protein
MLSDRITVNNIWYNKILAFISNPIIGLLLAFLMSVLFYVISISSKMPYYYLTQPKSSMLHSQKASKITVKGESLKNLYFIDLVLWNNGTVFIDHTDFIASRPIILKAKEPVSIIACNILKQSRADLKFSTKIGSDGISITMNGEEALEVSDGISFRIFYTTPKRKSIHFIVHSRIKGTPNGFEYKDLKRASRSEHTNKLLTCWGIIISLLLIRVVTLLLVGKPIVFRRIELIILLLTLITCSYYTYEYFYSAINIPWYNVEGTIP